MNLEERIDKLRIDNSVGLFQFYKFFLIYKNLQKFKFLSI